MTRVLIAESLDEKVLNDTKSSIEFVYKPDITVAELEREIADYDGLIVRPKQVTEKAVNSASELKLIIRGGAGVNSIALDACKSKGIVVENTPGLNSDATAEYSFALMLQLLRRNAITRSDSGCRKGNPGAPEPYGGNELKGKKLGVVGLGNIGFRVASIAEAFGMDVTFFVREKKHMPYEQVSELGEFLSMGHDIISLHIPLTAQTRNFLGKNQFALMKKGTILINTARPQLVDPAALAQALDDGTVSSFGIDGDYELIEPFLKIDKDKRGIITHHIADCTVEAQANITRQVLKQAIAFFERGEYINRVV